MYRARNLASFTAIASKEQFSDFRSRSRTTPCSDLLVAYFSSSVIIGFQEASRSFAASRAKRD